MSHVTCHLMDAGWPTGANIRLASHLFKTLREESQHGGGHSQPWCLWKDCDTHPACPFGWSKTFECTGQGVGMGSSISLSTRPHKFVHLLNNLAVFLIFLCIKIWGFVLLFTLIRMIYDLWLWWQTNSISASVKLSWGMQPIMFLNHCGELWTICLHWVLAAFCISRKSYHGQFNSSINIFTVNIRELLIMQLHHCIINQQWF